MGDLNLGATTKTDLSGIVLDYSVTPQNIDVPVDDEEVYWDFPHAQEQLNYYKTIPQLKKAIDALATWTAGKGLTCDSIVAPTLNHLKGIGNQNYQQIFKSLIVDKKIFGDAFAEIVRHGDPVTGRILNIKPLYTGHMRIVIKKGVIIRYEQRVGAGKPNTFEPHEILHLSNDRIGNEIHGTSVLDVCKWVIDAKQESMEDYRKVLHRNVVPVRIIEVDTDNPRRIAELSTEYAQAIKKGEVLIIPKGTVTITDATITIQDPVEWINYLDNFFYQAVGVPRVIASSQEYSEASSKVGYLTFEPVYTQEQNELEIDLFNQAGLILKFNRPPSLSGMLQDSEAKNTGQTGFQPNEVTASVKKNE